MERAPVYEQTALYRGADDIGNTYIEIDYTKQHMWYYKDGALRWSLISYQVISPVRMVP